MTTMRPSFQGCTEHSCIYHGAFLRAARHDRCFTPLLVTDGTKVVCEGCGEDYTAALEAERW